MSGGRGGLTVWFARGVVGVVFAANVGAAVSFISRPAAYAPAFELSGLPGQIAVQAVGILFLMWNATYPPVILRPNRQSALFLIILCQQAIGVLGEAWIWLRLPAGHAALQESLRRFLIFDALGLMLLGLAFALANRHRGRGQPSRIALRDQHPHGQTSARP